MAHGQQESINSYQRWNKCSILQPIMVSSPYDPYDYPTWWEGREFEHKAEKIALVRLLSQIERRKSIVDIGAGFGRLTPIYAPFFSRITLVDTSEKLLAIAKEYTKNIRGISFVRTDSHKLPFPAESFDVAISVRVYHHFENPSPTLTETARVLKEEGFFILEFANKIHFTATLGAILKGNFSFRNNFMPRERSSYPTENKTIKFLNHHPKAITLLFEQHGFKVIEQLSVSNLRDRRLKKIFPIGFLIFIEERIQKPLAKLWFGPSIFVLAQKRTQNIVRPLKT